MTERTELQRRQDNNRTRKGKFNKGPECEACGKPAGHEYASLSICEEKGVGLVLCSRKSCPAMKLETEEEIAEFLIAKKGGR